MSTLKEGFKSIVWIYKEEFAAEQCEKLADQHAIDFNLWNRKNYHYYLDGLFYKGIEEIELSQGETAVEVIDKFNNR